MFPKRMYKYSYWQKENCNVPNRMDHRTLNLPSRKVTNAGKGVTTFHDLKSQIIGSN